VKTKCYSKRAIFNKNLIIPCFCFYAVKFLREVVDRNQTHHEKANKISNKTVDPERTFQKLYSDKNLLETKKCKKK